MKRDGTIGATLSPVELRIIAALDKHGDMEPRDIAEAACCSYETLTGGGYLRAMVKAELIRIAKYQRALVSGPPVPIYSVTPGENATRPRPYSDSEKCRRWRKKTGHRTPEWHTKENLKALLKVTRCRS